ncbi:CIDEC family protein [Megaselia abdita]
MENTKTFKIKDVTRTIIKVVSASSLEELRCQTVEVFEKADELPKIHLDSDGTEIDDEEYFSTLDANTEIMAVFPGEHWTDMISHFESYTHIASDNQCFDTILEKLKSNLCHITKINDSDLDSLSNMDPNSLVDITGKDFAEQVQQSRSFGERSAEDRIHLLKLLRSGAIFSSNSGSHSKDAGGYFLTKG